MSVKDWMMIGLVESKVKEGEAKLRSTVNIQKKITFSRLKPVLT